MKRRRVPTANNPLAATVQVLRIDPRLYSIDPETLPNGTPQEQWFREFVQHLQGRTPDTTSDDIER